MIADYPLIPDQAFLYMPNDDKKVQFIDGKRNRIIFSGGVPFDEEQNYHVSQLKKYINKQTTNQYLSSYSDDYLLRFLQACSFNYQQCVQTLEQYHIWQKKMLPLELTDDTIKYLRQGVLYMSGRDYHFRPIVVVNIKRILESKMKEEQLQNILGFFYQYLIENCLIEGQVQTWNTITDLQNCSLFSLGGTLINIIKHLSNIFKARSNHIYLINSPNSIKLMFGMLKNVLKQDQIRKITVLDDKILGQQVFNKINRHQVQAKYGGSRPNMKNFWPIQIDPYVFEVDKSKMDRLLTQAQYDKLYIQGKLKDRKIKKSLIKKFSKTNKQFSMRMMSQQDILTQRNGNLVQNQMMINSKSDLKIQQVMFPDEKVPMTPPTPQKSFTFFQLF